MSRRHEVALAALLHDVGKVAERAGVEIPPAELTALRREHCPEGSHLHAAYTAWVLARHEGTRLLAFAARHHAPATPLEAVVAVAQRHAASRPGQAHADGSDPALLAQRRLEPALARVRREGAVSPRQPTHLPLRPLSFRPGDLDPAAGDGPSATLAREEYLGLWDRLDAGLAALPPDAAAALPAALALVERLGARVPAGPAEQHADVALSDHCRLAAALATALYAEVVEERDEADRALVSQIEDRETERLLLYGGEIHGGDSLFAGLSPRIGPAALTGRSLWLALLAEAAAARVLVALDLPETSRIHAADTRFLLVLPARARERLAAVAAEIDLALLDLGRGRLHYAWGAVPLALADLSGSRLSRKWMELAAAVEESAHRPFGDLLSRARGYEALFQLPDLPKARCLSCGGDLESAGDCGDCARFEALGRSVSRARGLARVRFDLQARAERALRDAGAKPLGSVGLAPLGCAYLALAEIPGAAVDLGEGAAVWSLAPDAEVAGIGARVGLAPPPRRGGEQPCGSLAGVARGARLWGVLTVDFDDLAATLERGFPESERTLARALGLSRAVHHFFAGYAASLAVRDDAVHVVRVGGDALVAVAPWDHLPGLALAVRDALHRYAGGSVAVGLSAGIALGAEDDRVGDLFAEADAALARAKAAVHPDGRRKDALCLFGIDLGWSDAALAAEMAQLLADASPRVREALHSTLGAVARGARRGRAPRTLREVGAALSRGRWTWRMVARLTEVARSAGAEQALVLRVQRALAADDWEGLRHERPLPEIAEVAVRWSRLLTRTEGVHEHRAAPG